MAELVLMPKLGFNMEKGQLVKWLVAEGEPVEKGDVLFEIMTDKTNVEIEATTAGVVRKILLPEGETVPVTLPVAIIAGADEDIASLEEEAAQKLGIGQPDPNGQKQTGGEAPAPTTVTWESSPEEGAMLKVTPRARKLAAEKGLDLAALAITGSGYEGGITEGDVLAYLEANRVKATPVAKKLAAAEGIDIGAVTGTGAENKVMKEDVERELAAKQPSSPPAATPEKEVLEVIPYEGVRKVIGDRLSHSKFTAPHLYFTTSVDTVALMEMRVKINAGSDNRVSLNDLVVAAVVKALQKHPRLNASLEGDKIVLYKNVNIGIAAAMDKGLIVPVIKNAHNMKLSQLAAAARELIQKARANKLLPGEYSGGTFTVSNLGMYGIENFTAIINPPETGILAVSAIKKKPVVVSSNDGDEVVIRPMMNITMSVDHRLIDGVLAAQFLQTVQELLENPFQILI